MQEEAVASFRLSPQQEREWLLEPEGPSGRKQIVVRLDGPLDPTALRDAFRATVERHEILRTTFQRRTGMRTPLQVVNDELEPHWRDVVAEDAADLDRLAEEERTAVLAFDSGPLVRALLVRRTDDRHDLVLTLPSVYADANSLATLVRDLAAQYGNVAAVEPPLQYADFAEWQHELRETEDEASANARAFWAAFGPAKTPAIPFLRRPSAPSPIQRLPISLSEQVGANVDGVAERYGVKPEVVALAAWVVVLGRLSRGSDVDVSVALSDRHYADLDNAVGALQRVVPVRVSFSEDATFAEVLDRTARSSGDSLRWQDYAPGEDSSGIGFVAPTPLEKVSDGSVTFSVEDVVVAEPRCSLTLVWSRVDGRWSASLAYDQDAFEAAQADRLAGRFARVLAAVVADSSVAVEAIDLVDDDARRELLHEFNATARKLPETTIDALVREASAKHPSSVAVEDANGTITYAELDVRVNRVARRLRELGVDAGTVVGLCTDRSVDMVVGLLGILRAGAAYLPLHFEHPPARLLHQLAETQAPVVLTQAPLVDRLAGFEGTLLRLEEDEDDSPVEPLPPAATSADDLVYVIYTSGSTGTPKGVAVTNGNLVNYVTNMRARLDADEQPLSFGVVTAISTDLGNTSVFTALCTGGTLSLISPTIAADPGALAEWLAAHPVDVLKITPSHVGALLVGAEAAQLLPRKWLIVGGEACSWDLVARVRELSECRILNHYGPTETTVGSCTMLVDDGPGPYAPATVPIGRPIANTACYVLDSRGEPTPVGVAGALFIAGAGVARGYVGQDELTAERFLRDPFEAAPGGRMYRTGDLARWLPDGTLEFLGREDEQIKIRGFRVEPAEVEAVLLRAPGVREAAVVACAEASGEQRLVAYVVGDGADDASLRTHAAEYLPEFMIPSAVVVMDHLPRTASGKIDRQNLPEPEAASSGQREEYVAPRTPMEEKVAAIWADVLGLERVGIHDDFFALGGHSLLATQIVAQIRSDFAVDLPLHSLFTDPTVESLSRVIVELMAEGGDGDTAALLAELEGLSDEEAERLLAGEIDEGDGSSQRS